MLVFVYGTLKKGFSNHRILEGEKYIDRASSYEKYALYNYRFPFAVHEDNAEGVKCLPIMGEVYEASRDCVGALDSLERAYVRVSRPFFPLKGGLVNAFIYEFPNKEPYGFKLLCEEVGGAYEWKG